METVTTTLVYAIAPPAVLVASDGPGSLRLDVVNASESEPVAFANPRGEALDPTLLGLADEPASPEVDRLYVSFSTGEFGSATVTALDDRFVVAALEDRSVGRYWAIVPRETCELPPGGSASFELSDLVAEPARDGLERTATLVVQARLGGRLLEPVSLPIAVRAGSPVGLGSPAGPALDFAVAPPGVVYTTVDPAHPVENALQLDVMNPGRDDIVKLANPSRLTPADPLPLLGEPLEASPLDRIYVYFPWGDQPGALCTAAESLGIRLSPLEDDWYQVPLSKPEIGRYWILFPREVCELPAQSSRGFRLDGIVAASKQTTPQTLTQIYVEPSIHGMQLETQRRPVYRRVPETTVLSFDSTALSVARGDTVTLSWRTLAASKCRLDPGAKWVELDGSADRRIDADMTFRLTAFGAGDPAHEVLPISVIPVEIDEFAASPPAIEPGLSTTLAWQTAWASRVTIEPDLGIGEVPKKGSATVTPATTTDYTLTAVGLDGPVASTIRVGVGLAIMAFIAEPATVQTPGDPVTLSWSVVDSTAQSIDHGVGAFPPSGSVVVHPGQSQSYTLTATGPNGAEVKESVAVTVVDQPAILSVSPSNGSRLYTSQPAVQIPVGWTANHCVRFHLKAVDTTYGYVRVDRDFGVDERWSVSNDDPLGLSLTLTGYGSFPGSDPVQVVFGFVIDDPF